MLLIISIVKMLLSGRWNASKSVAVCQRDRGITGEVKRWGPISLPVEPFLFNIEIALIQKRFYHRAAEDTEKLILKRRSKTEQPKSWNICKTAFLWDCGEQEIRIGM
jgi:hypothetical protein